MDKNNLRAGAGRKKSEIWKSASNHSTLPEILSRVRNDNEPEIIDALVCVAKESVIFGPEILDRLGSILCETSSRVYVYILYKYQGAEVPIAAKEQIETSHIVEDLLCDTCKWRLDKTLGGTCPDYGGRIK